MEQYQIAVIPGDGIGPEVMAECVRVLEKAAELDGRFCFDFSTLPWGCGYYLETGRMMPENGMDLLRSYDAILLGAIGMPLACCAWDIS